MSEVMMRSVMSLWLGLLLVCAPAWAHAQTGTVMPSPVLTFLDTNGDPLSGCKLYSYQAGTTTPLATYTDSTLDTANANPVVCDAAGRLTAFLDATTYKFTLKTSADVTIWTVDNVSSVPETQVALDVTGTAGETLSAGDVVYLSDGSGSLVAGQWYLADADVIYASVYAGTIGVAPSDIDSGVSGIIRLQGRVTGLSALTPGSEYYVSATAGGLTATAPTNVRRVGTADSATSFVLAANPRDPTLGTMPGVCNGRITLTTGVPVTTSDVTAATTVRFTPYKGNRCVVYNGTFWQNVSFTEVSLALGSDAADTNYDLYAYLSSGALTLERLAWTNGTTRATEIIATQGVYTKTGDQTRLYLGTYRTTATIGQTEDSAVNRFVWNYYHRVARPLRYLPTTDTWNYTTNTWRQANAGVIVAQVAVVVGVAEDAIDLTLRTLSWNTDANIARWVGLGVNSTTAPSALSLGPGSGVARGATAAGAYVAHEASLDITPSVGYSFIAWLERSTASGATTWVGDGGDIELYQCGISGEWLA